MKFPDFERAAHDAYDEIPEHFKDGIDGLVVSRESPTHPERPDVYTMGECLTESHMSDYGSPETTRSFIAIYWGSFRQIAGKNEDFDWDEEIWETLTHELRHHLESLAGDDALEGVDYATDETIKRDDGEAFDPWYYQHGDHVAPGVFKVETNFYVELELTDADFAAADEIEFEWKGEEYAFERPDELGDVHFVWIEGLDPEVSSLEVVLTRKRGWLESAKRLLGATRPRVLESRVDFADDGDAGAG